MWKNSGKKRNNSRKTGYSVCDSSVDEKCAAVEVLTYIWDFCMNENLITSI